MLLSDRGLLSAMNRGDLTVTPYDPALLQPASYDVTLAAKLLVQQGGPSAVMDPAHPDPARWSEVTVGTSRYFDLTPGMFVLASTIETVRLSPSVAARVEGKSTLGRCGLAIHTTAGWIDPGWSGKITLELSCAGAVPVRLRPGMKIGQLAVFLTNVPAGRPYGSDGVGRYQGQTAAQGPR